MRSDILLLTGAPPRLVIFIKLITACSDCLCKLLSFCSEWNLRQPHWRRTRRCEMRSDTLLLAGEVPRVVSLIEISPTPLRFSRQPPIAVRSEILHQFRVSSPLFQRGLAGSQGQSPFLKILKVSKLSQNSLETLSKLSSKPLCYSTDFSASIILTFFSLLCIASVTSSEKSMVTTAARMKLNG